MRAPWPYDGMVEEACCRTTHGRTPPNPMVRIRRERPAVKRPPRAATRARLPGCTLSHPPRPSPHPILTSRPGNLRATATPLRVRPVTKSSPDSRRSRGTASRTPVVTRGDTAHLPATVAHRLEPTPGTAPNPGTGDNMAMGASPGTEDRRAPRSRVTGALEGRHHPSTAGEADPPQATGCPST